MKLGEAIELLEIYRGIFGVRAEVVFKSLPVVLPPLGTSDDFYSYLVTESRQNPHPCPSV